MPEAMEFIRTDMPLGVNSSRERFGEVGSGPAVVFELLYANYL